MLEELADRIQARPGDAGRFEPLDDFASVVSAANAASIAVVQRGRGSAPAPGWSRTARRRRARAGAARRRRSASTRARSGSRGRPSRRRRRETDRTGAIEAWLAPLRGGARAAVAGVVRRLTHPFAERVEQRDLERVPWPVAVRARSAVRIPEYAYMPAAMSATEMPTFARRLGLPVTDTSPTSLCTSRSYAFLRAYGPDDP